MGGIESRGANEGESMMMMFFGGEGRIEAKVKCLAIVSGEIHERFSLGEARRARWK